MTDLITRLRTAENTTLGVGAMWDICDEAADEIERVCLPGGEALTIEQAEKM